MDLRKVKILDFLTFWPYANYQRYKTTLKQRLLSNVGTYDADITLSTSRRFLTEIQREKNVVHPLWSVCDNHELVA